MATVWLARDTRLGRRVAVKVISEVLAAQEPYVERFRREARIAAGLSHPNLVQVYDFGSDVGRPFLVMEYIDGVTLGRASAIGAKSPLSSETLARELLDALGHIHAAGIVHRDIKPANVLVGPDGRPRLTDFGIAQAEDSTELTETGQVIGTLKYLAPEVARGRPASPRSDLYSLGVMLSEVAGRDASPALAHLIDRLVATDPSRRPSSAADALSALDGGAHRTGPTRLLPQIGEGPTPRLSAPRRDRHAVVAMAVAAAVAAVIVIVVIATSGPGRPSGGTAGSGVAPSNAPLSRQLTSLDRAVDQATRP
jgi:serine/threonine protein kinase